jgi:hypothetical protein
MYHRIFADAQQRRSEQLLSGRPVPGWVRAAAQSVNEECDHALRTAIILSWHAQAGDCMEKFI